MDQLASALNDFLSVLKRLGIRHAIGGSLASGVHGVYRATADVDIVAEVRPLDADRVVAELGRDWYADSDTIRRSISAGRSFNLIHIPTSSKIDIFPGTTRFHAVQLERATTESFEYMGTPVACPVATAEDILLANLRWYRDGGEVSERQWSDVLGILAVQTVLDDPYLDSWAGQLGVADLLARARACAKSSC
jgi:hypothetical protein